MTFCPESSRKPYRLPPRSVDRIPLRASFLVSMFGKLHGHGPRPPKAAITDGLWRVLTADSRPSVGLGLARSERLPDVNLGLPSSGLTLSKHTILFPRENRIQMGTVCPDVERTLCDQPIFYIRSWYGRCLTAPLPPSLLQFPRHLPPSGAAVHI